MQFGDSTDLIGSAVLINPGSSNPKGPSEINFIKEFYSKHHVSEPINFDLWRNFTPDSTMYQLEKLFNGWYIGKSKKMEGVIQLFNCFYFKEQDLDKAIHQFNSNPEFIFKEGHLFKDKPVYFGWGNTGKITPIKDIALKIFTEYDISKTPMYESEFEANCFYHPGYINRSYNTNTRTMEIVSKFSNLLG